MQGGSWAEWVSGLATAGSLFLAFYILLRDRRKADQAEATQVVTWFVNQPNASVELTITNGAARPIVHVTFHLATVDEDGNYNRWRIFDIASVLEPGQSSSFTAPFAEFHANALYPSYVQFRDANGLSWRRNVRSGRLQKARVGLTWRQHLALTKSPRKAIKRMRIRHSRW